MAAEADSIARVLRVRFAVLRLPIERRVLLRSLPDAGVAQESAVTMRFRHPPDREKDKRKLYNDPKWRTLRVQILERDRYVCQVPRGEVGRTPAHVICGKPATIADHITRPEEGGERFDPRNLRAACRSCNFRRHDVRYFRTKLDAIAAGQSAPWGSAASGITDAIRHRTRSTTGLPTTDDPRFIAWAMSLHGVDAEPADHGHARWAVSTTVYTRDRGVFQVCGPGCPSPVRWPHRPSVTVTEQEEPR